MSGKAERGKVERCDWRGRNARVVHNHVQNIP